MKKTDSNKSYRRVRRWEKFIFIFFPFFLAGSIFWSSYLPFYKDIYLRHRCAFSLKRELGTLFFAGYSAFYSFFSALESPELKDQTSLPEVRLYIPRGSLRELSKDVPDSTRKYYNALLKFPDQRYRRVEFRMRGSGQWHWDPNKPSLRIKTSKGRLYNKRRYLEVINPEDKLMMRNLLEDYITHQFGVMASFTSFSTLYLNNKYFGVYNLTLRPNKIFLQEHKRMPGIIYKYRGAGEKKNLALWEDPKSWSIMNGAKEGEDAYKPISELLTVINSDVTKKSVGDLWKIFNKDKMARWMAAMNLVQGIHTDAHHNHLYYFDPTIGRIEPIGEDINGHGLATCYSPFRFLETLKIGLIPEYKVDLTEKLTPFTDYAFRDPFFAHKRNQYLWDAINGFGSSREQSKFIDENVKLIDSAVKSDVHRGYLRNTPAGPQRLPYPYFMFRHEIWIVKKWIKKREDFIRQKLEECRVKIYLKNLNQADTERGINCLIKIEGASSARLNIEDLKKKNSSLRLFDIERSKDIDTAHTSNVLFYPGMKKVDANPVYRHFFGMRFPEYALTGGICDYQLKISGVNKEALMELLSTGFKNAITGKKIVPEVNFVNDISKFYGDDDFIVHPWEFEANIPKDVSLGPGEVEIKEDLFLDSNDSLKIFPGTTLLMHPGVSIFCRGKAILSGEENSPISIARADPDKPWGAFVLQGQGTGGSVFRYVNFSGGSLAANDNIDYSGMVSVHWCPDIVIENCKFSKNTISDDCLHIMHSNARVKNSQFFDTNADSIDFDYVSGLVESCTFKNSGNDALDLMGSSVRISNSSFLDADDKGVSVGERSAPVIYRCEFSGCNIGVESKDASEPIIYDCDFRSNETAYHAYLKKWAYDHAGHGYLIESRIDSSNTQGIILDDDSQLKVYKSDILADITPEEKLIRLDILDEHIVKKLERLKYDFKDKK